VSVVASGRASLVQEWYLLAQAADPAAPPLHCHAAYRVRGHLDVERLRRAAQDLVDCHPSLRTAFAIEGNLVTGSVLAEAAIEVVTAGEAEAGVAPDEGARMLEREAVRPFDRSLPPLARLVVVAIGPREHLLALVVDHLVADGLSFDILLRDLAASYGERGRGGRARLDPSGAYLEYAAEQRRDFAEGRGEELADHWREQLGPSLESFSVRLPGYRGEAELSGSQISRVALPEALASRLAEAAEKLHTTKFCLCLTAAQALIATLTGRRRVTTLTSCANRFDERYEGTVGWFANGIFPTAEIDLAEPRRVLFERVEDAVLGALEHADMPAWHVRRRIWPELASGFRREPGVYLMYRALDGAELELEGAALEPIELEEEVDTPGLQFWILERDGSLELQTHHYRSEYPREDAERHTRRFVAILESLLVDFDEPLGLSDPLEHEGGKVHV
jgi:hypothetical protein